MAMKSPVQSPPAEHRGSVLLADDEPEPLRAFARVLRRAGFRVDSVSDGRQAAEALKTNVYDAILSDISMPGMTGIELLQLVHRHNEEIPVVLITGAPAVETAVDALEHGAYKYLLKPVSPERLEEVVAKAVQLRRMARLRREAVEVLNATPEEGLDDSFQSALSSLWMAYQPIVGRDGSLFGHEALMRSNEPRLPHPGAVLEAAEKLRGLDTLGRLVRKRAVEPYCGEANGGTLFVNLHPNDLEDDDLLEGHGLPEIASRVVLEITERASVGSIQDLRARISALRAAGYRIAVDDLGAGYAGLTSFALLEPEIVKVDMTLVRDVDTMPVKQRLVKSITSLCSEMSILVVCEGVETRAERDVLLDLGCDLFQGFWIAKPEPPFPAYRW